MQLPGISALQSRPGRWLAALLFVGRQAGYKFSPILASVQIWGRGGCGRNRQGESLYDDIYTGRLSHL